LTGQNKQSGISPYIFPVAFGKCRADLVQFGLSNGYVINGNPAFPHLLNPREIDVWFALDEDGVQDARKRIEEQGTPSNGYYRGVFPDPVLYCGFSVPNPSLDSGFQDWFNVLIEKFTPWKKRFWDAFEESS
jgi:hypothetical protein